MSFITRTRSFLSLLAFSVLSTLALVGPNQVFGQAVPPAAGIVRPTTPVAPKMLAVVTIRNQTPASVNYQVRWAGGQWKEFRLDDKKYRLHSFPTTAGTAEVRFDHSFQPGYQEKIDYLAARDFPASDGRKPIASSDGLVYDFRLKADNSGIDLIAETPLNRNNLASERGVIDSLREKDGRKTYPGLLTNYEVLAPSTGKYGTPGTYNCIAWSIGDTSNWVWPRSSPSVDDFDALYTQHGFRRLKAQDYSYQPGIEKIVLYGKVQEDGTIAPTHAARQDSSGAWTSKLGGMARIRHLSPEALAGPSYGQPIAVYYRKM